MSIAIKEVAFINFPTTDVPRTRAFYEGVLGLSNTLAIELEPGKWWLEYNIGDTTLALSNLHAPEGRGGCCVALEVADLDAALASLQAAGVTPSFAPMETPVCRILGLKDPDGNDLALHQRKAKA